ncbi:MAG: putative quinol monooxygenase [Desulfosudaceae bacterium]
MVVVARLKIQQGKEAEAEAVLTDLVSRVKEEPDTLVYVLHRNQNNPGEFLFYEKYKDAEALMAHSTTDHFNKAFESLGPLLAEKPDIQTYDEIAGI